VLGTSFEQRSPEGRFAAAAEAAFAAFPRLTRFAATHRMQHDVDRHALGTRLITRGGSSETVEARELGHVVDRIGAGDAFAAGVLHGLHSGFDDARALRFGLAAAWLKHSLPGDFNLVDAAAVQAAMDDGGFHVRR
jgi:2-dehydro-3-deoxygluconokinase